MVDQISHVRVCRRCGAPMAEDAASTEELCPACAAYEKGEVHAGWLAGAQAGSESAAPYASYYSQQTQSQPDGLDPDRPAWGVGWGIATWLFSFVATLIVSVIAILIWYLIERRRGVAVPDPINQEEFRAWLLSPNVIFISVVSTVGAHLVTFAFCWLVITRFRKRPFWSSLGWNWAGKSFGYWMLASLAIVFGILMISQVFVKFLPQGKTPFDEMIDTSRSVRIAVAAMAILTAPLIEELVYRGVLFAGLRKHLALWPTIAIVTLLFAGVHVPQYWGAWASMAALMTLSLALTAIRGYSKSLLPCVLIHMVFNASSAFPLMLPDRELLAFGIFLGCVALSLIVWYFLRSRHQAAAVS